MSPSAYIQRRHTEKGAVRYTVRYRTSGRQAALRWGGSFKTLREARLRRDFIAGELAAGRVPVLREPEPVAARTVIEAGEEYVASRIDVDEATRLNYSKHLKRLRRLGPMSVDAVTPADVQAWVVGDMSDLKPSSVKRYVTTLRQILDFAGRRQDNPAKDPAVRLPQVVQEEVNPPTAAEVATIIAGVPRKWRLAIRLLEATAMRVGELVALKWGDVDVAGDRLRLPHGGKTRAARRWAQVPWPLMDEIADLVAPEDRAATRLVLPGFSGQGLRQAMARACRAAGIAVYSPHDLRHRRLSLWHMQGVPARELAARAGHSRSSLTLDVYSHVVMADDDEWRDGARWVRVRTDGLDQPGDPWREAWVDWMMGRS